MPLAGELAIEQTFSHLDIETDAKDIAQEKEDEKTGLIEMFKGCGHEEYEELETFCLY